MNAIDHLSQELYEADDAYALASPSHPEPGYLTCGSQAGTCAHCKPIIAALIRVTEVEQSILEAIRARRPR